MDVQAGLCQTWLEIPEDRFYHDATQFIKSQSIGIIHSLTSIEYPAMFLHDMDTVSQHA